MNKIDVLLIYPQLGSWDDVLRDIPLSLIYAATHSVKAGYKVRILDLRLYPDSWEEQLDEIFGNEYSLVGLSVMTGNPIRTSLKISKYIKKKYADIPIVWGGPHPTILPEQTLESPFVDFVIRDWGSKALCGLLDMLTGKNVSADEILGLGYKDNGEIKLAPAQDCFEMLDFKDIPYQLVDISGTKYNRLQSGELIFPIYTSMGCPYKCRFCMSPIVYQKIRGGKWVSHDVKDVLDHIEYLSKNYSFRRIQIYDDDSFVNQERMREFFIQYIKRGYHIKYKLDFRGARINELNKMDDQFLQLMVKAGVELLCIGVESGSLRILKLMGKNITPEQILRVNRKLSKYPSLKSHYNFFSGIPGERYEDLVETKELLLQLVKDHPRCYLGAGCHWKPVPGTQLTDTAVKDYGYNLPTCLEEWAEIDILDASPPTYPWYTKKIVRMINLLALEGLVLDSKVKDFSSSFGWIGKIIYFINWCYRPFILLRLKFNFSSFLFEHAIRRFCVVNLSKLIFK